MPLEQTDELRCRGLSYGADALNLRAVGDLLVGRYGRSHMVILVERRSRLILPLLDATTAPWSPRSQQLQPTMRRSLT